MNSQPFVSSLVVELVLVDASPLDEASALIVVDVVALVVVVALVDDPSAELSPPSLATTGPHAATLPSQIHGHAHRIVPQIASSGGEWEEECQECRE